MTVPPDSDDREETGSTREVEPTSSSTPSATSPGFRKLQASESEVLYRTSIPTLLIVGLICLAGGVFLGYKIGGRNTEVAQQSGTQPAPSQPAPPTPAQEEQEQPQAPSRLASTEKRIQQGTPGEQQFSAKSEDVFVAYLSVPLGKYVAEAGHSKVRLKEGDQVALTIPYPGEAANIILSRDGKKVTIIGKDASKETWSLETKQQL